MSQPISISTQNDYLELVIGNIISANYHNGEKTKRLVNLFNNFQEDININKQRKEFASSSYIL